MSVILVVLGCVFLLLALVGIIMTEIAMTIVFTVMGITSIFFGAMLNRRKVQKRGFLVKVKLRHLMGLPFAEGAKCVLYLTDVGYEFERNNQKIKLNMNRVQDVSIKTDKEIQSSYVSSAGGAIGGAMLFGPLGAIIGGRAKKKTSAKITKCLIILANTEDGLKCISFDCTNKLSAVRFLSAFKRIKKESIVTEL